MVKKGNPRRKKKARKGPDPKSKTYAERVHAGHRLEERYEIPYTTNLRLSLISKIKNNESKIIKKCSHRVTNHLVHLNGIDFNIIYDKSRKEIVTFLPMKKQFDAL